MAITIPFNDYKANNETRDEVVQGICDAFLSSDNHFKVFHPFSDLSSISDRNRTNCIIKHKRENKYYGFSDKVFQSLDEGVKFTKAELLKAVDILREHGYHFHSYLKYGTWMSYTCDIYPTVEHKTRVTTIEIYDDFDR